jgi:small subunit ribosomal protein S18
MFQQKNNRNRERVFIKKRCYFCKQKIAEIDYKDVATLSRYLNRWNKIQPKSRNGNCAKHQRWMTTAIKQARYLALLPYLVK